MLSRKPVPNGNQITADGRRCSLPGWLKTRVTEPHPVTRWEPKPAEPQPNSEPGLGYSVRARCVPEPLTGRVRNATPLARSEKPTAAKEQFEPIGPVLAKRLAAAPIHVSRAQMSRATHR